MQLRWCALAVTALTMFGSLPAMAQAVKNPLTDGEMLFHGNYCGPGNRGYDKAPVDALDAACRKHDLCTPDCGKLPSCACNHQLALDAARVAQDTTQPPELRDLAIVVSDGAQIPICEK